jgi:hypothetical protein
MAALPTARWRLDGREIRDARALCVGMTSEQLALSENSAGSLSGRNQDGSSGHAITPDIEPESTSPGQHAVGLGSFSKPFRD